MTPLIPFSYQDRPVRVVTIDDEPWFVATDITPVLGYQHGPSAIRRLEDDEHQQIAYSLVDPTVRPGFGPQTVTVVSEFWINGAGTVPGEADRNHSFGRARDGFEDHEGHRQGPAVFRRPLPGEGRGSSMTATDQKLTPEQVGEIYQKPASWVRQRRRQGLLKGVNVGTDRRPEWRFTREALAEFDRRNTK